MAAKKLPKSLEYSHELVRRSNEETLAAALTQAVKSADEGKYVPLCQLASYIIDDLVEGRLVYPVPKMKTERVYRGYNIDELTGEITPDQIGYLAGLSKKVNIDRYDLPPNISPKRNYKELTEGEAIIVIDTLKDMAEGI